MRSHQGANDPVTYTYTTYRVTEGPSRPLFRLPEPYFNRVERTELLYRVTKGVEEMNLCELETYYVRRYNKFPFFVKSVACQKNRGIQGKVKCNSRYEKGHILRLSTGEEGEQCFQGGEDGSLKWVHAWETRVVGCDAVIPVTVTNGDP